MKNILLVLSTTRQSPKTVDIAIDRAVTGGAKLTILFVLDSGIPESIFDKLTDMGFAGEKPSQQLQESILEEYRERGRRKVEEVAKAAAGKGISSQSLVKEGDFVAECLSAIARTEADLVIVTRKKRSSLSRFIFGSPIAEVKSRAGCELLIVDE